MERLTLSQQSLISTLVRLLTSTKRSPRVLIDATCVTKEKAGVGVYALNLLRQLADENLPFDLFVLVQEDDPEMRLDRGRLVTIPVPSRLARILPFRLLCEQLILPLLLAALRIDALHSLHYSFPVVRPGTFQIVTLHDMTSFQIPEVHLQIKLRYFRMFIRLAAKLAGHLIFVSESARSDFKALFPSNVPESTVTHLGKDARFHPDLPPNEIASTRLKYGLPESYVLYVGTLEPRKNLVRLVQAFLQITQRHPDISLVISGKKGWLYKDLFALVKSAGLEKKVIFTGFIAESDKPALISGAMVFAYPSLYEGFGIPVLEALACGVPVITSNIASLPEVAGGAAILLDPYDVNEIAKALDLLLSDHRARQALSEKALKQASRFSWQETAAATLKIYERCLQAQRAWLRAAI